VGVVEVVRVTGAEDREAERHRGRGNGYDFCDGRDVCGSADERQDQREPELQSWKLNKGLFPLAACACVRPAMSKPRIATRNRMAAIVENRRDRPDSGSLGSRFVLMSLRDRIFAASYDPLTARWEKRHGADLRRELLARARGRVLEIGVGTGLSLPHYPPVDELVATEPSEPMLRRARRRAREAGRKVTFVEAPAEQLPFEDNSFDTVVSMLVLCTVEDPQRALQEIRRVLRPTGQFLFSEHVRSDNARRARWQDRLEPIWGVVANGCHPNRRTLDTIREAGFDVSDVEQRELPGVPALTRPYVSGRAGGR
jgi:ubiquinone/menaquinone biosynthesis C-methylase UbiE